MTVDSSLDVLERRAGQIFERFVPNTASQGQGWHLTLSRVGFIPKEPYKTH